MKLLERLLLIITTSLLIALLCINCGLKTSYPNSLAITPDPILIGGEITVNWSSLESSTTIDHWIIEWTAIREWHIINTTYPPETYEATFTTPCPDSDETRAIKIKVAGVNSEEEIVTYAITDWTEIITP